VEAALRPWNKLLQVLLRLASACSGASKELQRYELAGSGDLAVPDLVGFSSFPSLVSVGICTDVGFSGESLGRYVYRAEKSGWLLFPTCSGGLVPLWVVSSSGEPGLLAVLKVPDSLSPVDVMAGGHLVQPRRSATIEHVDVFGVLLLVATKICDVSSSGWRSASSCKHCGSPLHLLVRQERIVWLLRPPAAKTTGRILQGLSCNFSFL
jgi:hypothetical protein